VNALTVIAVAVNIERAHFVFPSAREASRRTCSAWAQWCENCATHTRTASKRWI